MFLTEDCGCEEWSGASFVLLFFSAGWCPPCEQFLQVLKDFYNEVNIDQKNIEVIYIQSDKTEQNFKEQYTKMPWLTFPYSSPYHENLRKKFDIIGIPMVLVMEAETGFLITKKGRKDICDLGVNTLKNWKSELPLQIEKKKHLDEGFKIVEAIRIAQEEEEAKRRAAAEKDEF